MYTHTHTFSTAPRYIPVFSLGLLLGSTHTCPPPPLNYCFPRDGEENAVGEEGKGDSVGILINIKCPYYYFNTRKLETAVSFEIW